MALRVKSGLKYRLLWTWDHSTNWDLNQPGQQEKGCDNPYLKPVGAFLNDYRKLIDFMAEQGMNGLIIWGFLRDAHGGVDAAQKLCRYAEKKGVRIIAGVGVMAYGGVYYEGKHEFSMAEWRKKHPEMSAVGENGKSYDSRSPRVQLLCPSREENVAWYVKGVKWLVENLDIGGINYEIGDYGVCHCPLCRRKASGVNTLAPGQETDRINVSFDAMAGLYPRLMETVRTIRPDVWQIYSPYCGYKRDMATAVKRFLDPVPEYAVCMWTLTHMLDEQHDFPWEEGLKFPASHNIGFFHQGSQWFHEAPGGNRQGRYDSIVEIIRRAAHRGIQSGLEGLCITGEVSATHPTWEKNYQAFSRSCRHPDSSAEAFQEVPE